MATIQSRNGNYKITVSCGYDINGKQIRKTTTWTPEHGMTRRQIEKELERQKVLFEEKCRTGQVLDGSIRFVDFAEKWFADYAEKQLRPTTVSRYKLLMPRINTAIGHIRLDKLQPHQLMTFYKNLAEENIRQDIKYKSKIDFKAMLKTKKLTKQELSSLSGVSVTTLNSVTNGANISATSADKICSALHKPLNKLFTPASENTRLSANTVLHHHRIISSILSSAVKWQILFANPCARVDPPKLPRKEACYLDEYEAARMLELLENEHSQNRTIVKLLLFTGLRRGELCGLEWKDVDFSRALLHVRRSSLYIAGKGVFADETKNETSVRSLKISNEALTALKEHRKWQLEERLKVGDQWQESNRIFTAWNGSPIRPDVITNWFGNFVKKNNLPPVHVHSLRHTNATLLIAAGTNLQTVAKRLGHANITTTGKVYAHAIKSADEAAAETLENILNPTLKKA